MPSLEGEGELRFLARHRGVVDQSCVGEPHGLPDEGRRAIVSSGSFLRLRVRVDDLTGGIEADGLAGLAQLGEDGFLSRP